MEKKSRCTLKALYSDIGGQFTSKEFDDFCEENDIHRELITPRTPDQNGVAEQKIEQWLK